MASNNQLVMTMDQQQSWQFRSDPWLADLYTKETETLTKALQKTYSPASIHPNDDVFASDLVDSLFAQPEPFHTPTISSENDLPFPKRKSMAASGRIAKRKSRASKRSTTTFITADPANFRQMVQQVTGVRFGGDVMQQPMIQSVLRPEPQRSSIAGGGGGGFDPSSFLLNSNSYVMNNGGNQAVASGGAVASGFGYDGFCSFPTLESWKV